MPRHARVISQKKVYHVMMRGNNKEKIFIDHEDKLKMIDVLSNKKQVNAYYLFAFCIMDNHIHIVIREDKDSLARIIKRIGICYAHYFNKKYKRIGHVFQDRYRSENIENDSHLLSVIRYVHRNPVKAGIGTVEGYPWSSYSEYINCSMGITNADEILGMISNDRAKAIKEFIDFNHEKTDDIFIDVGENKEIDDSNIYAYVENYLESKNIDLQSLNEPANRQCRDKLIQLLLEKSNISKRGIALILGLGRETVRRLSKEPSP